MTERPTLAELLHSVAENDPIALWGERAALAERRADA